MATTIFDLSNVDKILADVRVVLADVQTIAAAQTDNQAIVIAAIGDLGTAFNKVLANQDTIIANQAEQTVILKKLLAYSFVPAEVGLDLDNAVTQSQDTPTKSGP